MSTVSKSSGRGLPLAISLFVGYAIVAGLAGFLIFGVSGAGKQTNTTNETDANGALVKTTTETTRSAPALAIFVALAAGGWLLIPLKFAWDELAKNSDSARLSWQQNAEESRATAAKMRDWIFPTIEQHYSPLLYRFGSVEDWATRCKGQSGENRSLLLQRLFHSVAWLEEEHTCLRENGVVFMLRSESDEKECMERNRHLRDTLFELYDTNVDADAQLVHALRAHPPKDRRTVSFVTFQQRIKAEDPAWGRLGELFLRFEQRSSDDRLDKLVSSVKAAYAALASGLDRVYSTWYSDGLQTSSIPESHAPGGARIASRLLVIGKRLKSSL